MIVVTGAAGFIGSCIVAELNQRGEANLILVDHYDDTKANTPAYQFKKNNLRDKKFVQFLEKADFLEQVRNNKLSEDVRCIIHMGACSSTTLQDAQYFQENNFEYTQILAQWALDHEVRFIYASSAATYGDGSIGYKDDVETIRRCKPLNLYGESKQKFDEWVLDNNVLEKLVGLKFFNVFGPNEYHKEDMRSVVSKAYQRVVEEGKMSLFKSYHPEYKDGEQKRDFIYVKDAVDIVLYFVDHRDVNGIFNVGTGTAHTWNDLAEALFLAVGRDPNIEYIEMPESLRARYQYFTEADMDKLQASGYSKPFSSLQDSIRDYSQYLKDYRHL